MLHPSREHRRTRAWKLPIKWTHTSTSRPTLTIPARPIETGDQTAAGTSQRVTFKRHRPGIKHTSHTALYDEDQSPFFPPQWLDSRHTAVLVCSHTIMSDTFASAALISSVVLMSLVSENKKPRVHFNSRQSQPACDFSLRVVSL